MAFLYEKTEQGIRITGYEGPVSYLQIPEEIEGLPVRSIGQSSFARRDDLVYAKLPRSVVRLERFVFYGCPNLQKIALCDSIRDYYDGVFPQCRSLREIELDLAEKRYVVLRELLGDGDRLIRFTLKLPDGTARMTFPEYLSEYQEDTRARAIHMHIEGAGFSYRECVSRTGIDFRAYDRSFERVRYQEHRVAAQIALDRLLFPYALEEAVRAGYLSYIREHALETVEMVIRLQEKDWLMMLTEQNLLDKEAVQRGIRLGSEAGLAEFAAILMQASAGRPKMKRFEL